MDIITIIPARGGSKSIPKKNIYPICGQPLIYWSIQQSINTELISHTFVTTDDDLIAETSKKAGAKIIKRPDEISGDMASSEAALIHALQVIKDEYKILPDMVVFLQATSPIRRKDDIGNCIKKLLVENSDSIFSGCLLEDFLIWENDGGKWQSYNYDYLNRGLRQQRKPQYVENGSIYVFKPEILLNYNNRLGGKISYYEMEFWQTWEIDNPEDIEIVEAFMNLKIKQLS
jgi:CMP-N,N'-diacetyllegionaminic acid synthase